MNHRKDAKFEALLEESEFGGGGGSVGIVIILILLVIVYALCIRGVFF